MRRKTGIRGEDKVQWTNRGGNFKDKKFVSYYSSEKNGG